MTWHGLYESGKRTFLITMNDAINTHCVAQRRLR